jgi:hypothetical protein
MAWLARTAAFLFSFPLFHFSIKAMTTTTTPLKLGCGNVPRQVSTQKKRVRFDKTVDPNEENRRTLCGFTERKGRKERRRQRKLAMAAALAAEEQEKLTKMKLGFGVLKRDDAVGRLMNVASKDKKNSPPCCSTSSEL